MSIINLYEKSENLYFVGGIVRDELLGKKSPDVDLTYVGNAVEFAKGLDFEITQINEEFGSVHLKIEDKTFDITSTRTEIYPQKGHLPVVEKIGCSLKEDLIRRDFTVNAIAKNCKTGEIVDFVGGLDDLKNKKLRILHDESFVDDPTRIVRGLKFAVRFGFELEEKTKKMQNEYLQNVNYDMSFKRLKDELIDTFNLNRQEVLNKFIEQKIYKLLSKNDYNSYLCNVEDFVLPYVDELNYTWLVYLSGFDLSNLMLTKKEMTIIENYKKLAEKTFDDEFEKYLAFSSLDVETLLIYGLLRDKESVKKYLDKYRYVKLSISGDDLIKIGMTPSKKISEVLTAVMLYKYANQTISQVEELAIAKKYM